MTEKKKTVAEALDAAQDGQQFAQVLQELFGALEEAMKGENE